LSFFNRHLTLARAFYGSASEIKHNKTWNEHAEKQEIAQI
jgi:hypothetical protein